MIDKDLRDVGIIILGSGTNLFLNNILPPRKDSRLKLYTITTMNIALGIAYSRKLDNNEGYLYAGGSAAYALINLLNSITESSNIDVRDSEEGIVESNANTFKGNEAYFEHVNRAIGRANAEFNRNVTEPSYGGDWRRIDEYIRSPEGLANSQQAPYVRNNQYSWCGAFIAFVWGPQVKQEIRSKMVGCSTMYKNWSNTPRYVADKIPQAGDIVTIFPAGKDRSHIPGYHIALATSAPDTNGYFQTIEGNTIGKGLNMEKVEGVLPQRRHISTIANMYRLLPQDFVES